jgi:alkyldihydroxyacetonephosphate synthase
LSTNGLGYKGGRYGGMGDQALALEIALTDGSVVRTKTLTRHSTGPAAWRLLVGAEGSLGVITAAALRGYRIPERRELRAYRFTHFEEGFRAIDQIAALGLRPVLLDYGEEHASPWPDLVPHEEEPPLFFLGFEGLVEEVEASLTRAEAVVSAENGTALPQELVEEFWADRHVIAQRFARGRRTRRGWRNPDVAFDYLHVALPPSRVLEFRTQVHAGAAMAGVGLRECGLWTGPEMFSAAFSVPAALGGHERITPLIDSLLRKAQDLGGSMEYVHGSGWRLAHLMEREHASGFTLLQKVKDALDPAGILNPGKLGL